MSLETMMHADFRIIRVLEDRLVSSDCSLELSIDIQPNGNTSVAKEKLKAIKFWIEHFLDDSVAFGVGTEIDTTLLEQVANSVLMCPDDPHDYLMTLLIHSKLQAIGAPEVQINSTMLMSDIGEGFSNRVAGAPDGWLPSVSEWMGPRYYFDHPWWNRSDSSTTDLKPDEDDDLSIKPELGMDLLPLVSSKPRVIADPEDRPVAEIIKPAFKPRVISRDD